MQLRLLFATLMFQYVFPNPFEKTNIWFEKWNSFTERYKNYYVHHKTQNYSA